MGNEIISTEQLPYPGQQARCAGGKPVEECNVAPDLERGTQLSEDELRHSAIQAKGGGEDLVYPSVQAYFPLGCVACRQMCEAVYEVRNGERTSKKLAVFSMDPEIYERVRAATFEDLGRRMLSSLESGKKDKVTVQAPSKPR